MIMSSRWKKSMLDSVFIKKAALNGQLFNIRFKEDI